MLQGTVHVLGPAISALQQGRILHLGQHILRVERTQHSHRVEVAPSLVLGTLMCCSHLCCYAISCPCGNECLDVLLCVCGFACVFISVCLCVSRNRFRTTTTHLCGTLGGCRASQVLSLNSSATPYPWEPTPSGTESRMRMPICQMYLPTHTPDLPWGWNRERRCTSPNCCEGSQGEIRCCESAKASLSREACTRRP